MTKGIEDPVFTYPKRTIFNILVWLQYYKIIKQHKLIPWYLKLIKSNYTDVWYYKDNE